MRDLVVNHIDTDNFRCYGQTILMPDMNEVCPSFRSESQVYYGTLAIAESMGAWQYGIYQAKAKEDIVKELEQHKKTAELLFAIEGDFIIPAAISKIRGGKESPDHQQVCGFMVKQGEGIILNNGVWHCSPIPAHSECKVLVAFVLNTPDHDKTICILEENEVISLSL